MIEKSEDYRARALSCERLAKEASGRNIRQQWEELAIQWHAMANQAARLWGEISEDGYPSRMNGGAG